MRTIMWESAIIRIIEKKENCLGKSNPERRGIHLHLDRNTLTFIKALVSLCYNFQIKWHKDRVGGKKREAA